METSEIFQRLRDHFGAEVILSQQAAEEGVRDPYITVKAAKVDKVCLFCRIESDLAFDFCQSMTAVDHGDDLGCVYHLYSYRHRHMLVLKVRVPRERPRLPTVTNVWPVADWYEREAFDLYGIDFAGHPDLRRLLLPEDWPGHPMRKDWQEPKSYNGIPTTRENPLDLLEDSQ